MALGGPDYPKMLTTTITDNKGVAHVVPLVYPTTHAKAGAYAIVGDGAAETVANAAGLIATSTVSNFWENHHGGKS